MSTNKDMAVIRAFIAIDLPTPIQQQLESISLRLQSMCVPSSVRWVPARNIHLTLKFLGEVSSANLEMLKKILQSEASRHKCFEVSIGGLGAFPSIRRPRVIWVGVQAPGSLSSLQRGIEAETLRLGYAAEDRPFSAHLTLGRVSHSASPEEIRQIGSTLEKFKVGFLGALQVELVQLYRSDLQPGGAVYSTLFSAPLQP
jgi:2'-5' RNA ligase